MKQFKEQVNPLTTEYGNPDVYGEHVNYVKKLDVEQYRSRKLINLQAAAEGSTWDVLDLLEVDTRGMFLTSWRLTHVRSRQKLPTSARSPSAATWRFGRSTSSPTIKLNILLEILAGVKLC